MEDSRTNRKLLPSKWKGKSGTSWVAPGIDHHLVLILAEMLDRIALNRVAVKGWNRELLEKFTFQYALREGKVGCISGDGFKSVVVWHSCFLDSLLYKLVEILDANELFSLPPSMIMMIPYVGM